MMMVLNRKNCRVLAVQNMFLAPASLPALPFSQSVEESQRRRDLEALLRVLDAQDNPAAGASTPQIGSTKRGIQTGELSVSLA